MSAIMNLYKEINVQRGRLNYLKNQTILNIKKSPEYKNRDPNEDKPIKMNKIDEVTTHLKDLIIQYQLKPKDQSRICLTCVDIYAFCKDNEKEKHHIKMAIATFGKHEIWQAACQAVVIRYIKFLIYKEKNYAEAFVLSKKESVQIFEDMFKSYSDGNTEVDQGGPMILYRKMKMLSKISWEKM